MDILTIEQFLNLVRDYRKAEKKAKTSYLETDKSEAVNLGNKIDRIIKQRDKCLFEDEMEKQGLLF